MPNENANRPHILKLSKYCVSCGLEYILRANIQLLDFFSGFHCKLNPPCSIVINKMKQQGTENETFFGGKCAGVSSDLKLTFLKIL